MGRHRILGGDGVACERKRVAVKTQAGTDEQPRAELRGGRTQPRQGGAFVEGGGVAEVENFGEKAVEHLGEGAMETLELAGSDGRCGDLGGAQMAEQAFGAEMVCMSQGGEQGGQCGAGCGSLPSHARVELEVHGNAAVRLRSGCLERLHVLGRPEHRGEMMRHDGGGVLGLKAAHDQDVCLAIGQPGRCESLAHAGTLLGIAHAEPVRARCDEDGSAQGSTVTVGIRLEHAEWVEGWADEILDRGKVRAEPCGGDVDGALQGCVALRPGAIIAGLRVHTELELFSAGVVLRRVVRVSFPEENWPERVTKAIATGKSSNACRRRCRRASWRWQRPRA